MQLKEDIAFPKVIWLCAAELWFQSVYPYREVSSKASRGTAVLGGIDERQRPEHVFQQTAGERVRLFAAQTHARAQDALQVPLVF